MTGQSLFVLLADNNETAQKVYRRALERAGYMVLSALNGLDAVQIATRDKPALVVMDVAMPDIDGIEAMRRIKAKLPSLPILVATAKSTTTELEQCVAAGGAVLVKPFRLRDLVSAVAKLVSAVPSDG